MTEQNRLHIGFTASPTWQSGNAWRRAGSGITPHQIDNTATRLAQRAEAAHLDFVFRADTLFHMGVDPGSLDPSVQMAALAQHTNHIGLITTVSTTFMPPYILARQLQSLHWVSEGRAGWNIVTSLGGNDNFGLGDMPAAAQRYDMASEVLDAVQKLWNSFPDTAIVADKQSGQLLDDAAIQPIGFRGEWHSIKGPSNLPAHPAPLPLFQAGASESGRDFAAARVDAIFASCPDIDAALELRRDMQTRAVKHGRSPDNIRVLPGLSLYLADTREEANELFRMTNDGLNTARRVAFIKDNTGIDVSQLAQDVMISPDMVVRPDAPRSRTHADLLFRRILRDRPTVSVLMNSVEVAGSSHWAVIGTPRDAVDAIVEWHNAGAIDGFIAFPGGGFESCDQFFDHVMPQLVERDLFRSAYAGASLHDHLKRY